jgi:hypothetical protein
MSIGSKISHDDMLIESTRRYFSFFSTYPEIGHAFPAPKTCAAVSFRSGKVVKTIELLP